MSWENSVPVIGRVFSDDLVTLLGPARQPQEPITGRHEHLAASLQAMYESAFFHVLNDLSERTRYLRWMASLPSPAVRATSSLVVCKASAILRGAKNPLSEYCIRLIVYSADYDAI